MTMRIMVVAFVVIHFFITVTLWSAQLEALFEGRALTLEQCHGKPNDRA